jgi:primosomal protein N' (replication factor Y)
VYYYSVAIIGSLLEPLTYHWGKPIESRRVVSVELNGKERKAVVLAQVEKPSFKTLEIVQIHSSYFSEQQFRIARFIAEYYICSFGDALALFLPFSDKNHIEFTTDSFDAIVLSKKQQEAFDFVAKESVALLFGDTGSGKTEIYMHYFQEILAKQKRAIFLMPEISLTPQMGRRLEEIFGDAFVMWHSRLTPLQKKRALEKIESGRAKIIAGARSALFLPVCDVGVIVVDEEHDDSYKSASRPRYNARDLAIYVAKIYNAKVLLGSATPSLSSYVKFPHFRLRGGYYKTKKEYLFLPEPEGLSNSLIEALKKRVAAKEQSILFIPTRANFKYLVCTSCGETIRCAFCSVGMSLHHNINAMKCHYCNYTEPIAKECPKCHGNELISSRIGTAQAVKELKELIPYAKIEQFDRDKITTNKRLREALERFNRGEIDILVGTQMLSKGHDYHDVTLAVILGMDGMLGLGDYRAREKALSLLIQVAGRSGRAKDAKVIIQSYNKEFFQHYIENYELFLEDEKEFRKDLYPPYKRLCRLLFSHKKSQKAQDAMREMQVALLQFQNIEIVGAKACAIERVAGKYRYEILLRAERSTEIIKAIRATKVALVEVDMDPIDFT